MTRTENNVVSLPSAEAIEAEAASWFAKLQREDVSAEDRLSFRAWLAQSERHRETFDRLAMLWGELEILTELNDLSEPISPSDGARPFAEMGVSRRTFGTMAASLATVLVGGGSYVAYRRVNLREVAQFATKVGEQKTVVLSDGSTVQINTDSRVDVDFSFDARRVRLVRGEAHFEVAKDKRRPFSVFAAGGVVRAVGTAFAVRVQADQKVEVTVQEGRVALAALAVTSSLPSASDDEEASLQNQIGELTAGQSAVFTESVEQISQLPQAELNRKLSWRQGVLAYAGEPLAAVIEDISRYTDVTIEIVDPALEERPVGGYFQVGEVDALLDALEVTFGLPVERVDAQLVRVGDTS